MQPEPGPILSALLISPAGIGSREIQRILAEFQFSTTHVGSYREALDLSPKDFGLVFWDVGEGTAPIPLYQTVQSHFNGLSGLFGYSHRAVAADRVPALESALDWFFKDLIGMETLFKRSVKAQLLILSLAGGARSSHFVDDLWFSLFASPTERP